MTFQEISRSLTRNNCGRNSFLGSFPTIRFQVVTVHASNATKRSIANDTSPARLSFPSKRSRCNRRSGNRITRKATSLITRLRVPVYCLSVGRLRGWLVIKIRSPGAAKKTHVFHLPLQSGNTCASADSACSRANSRAPEKFAQTRYVEGAETGSRACLGFEILRATRHLPSVDSPVR